jgi:hypothetical protein
MEITGLDKYYSKSQDDDTITWKRFAAMLRVAIEASIHDDIASIMRTAGYPRDYPASCVEYCEKAVWKNHHGSAYATVDKFFEIASSMEGYKDVNTWVSELTFFIKKVETENEMTFSDTFIINVIQQAIMKSDQALGLRMRDRHATKEMTLQQVKEFMIENCTLVGPLNVIANLSRNTSKDAEKCDACNGFRHRISRCWYLHEDQRPDDWKGLPFVAKRVENWKRENPDWEKLCGKKEMEQKKEPRTSRATDNSITFSRALAASANNDTITFGRASMITPILQPDPMEFKGMWDDSTVYEVIEGDFEEEDDEETFPRRSHDIEEKDNEETFPHYSHDFVDNLSGAFDANHRLEPRMAPIITTIATTSSDVTDKPCHFGSQTPTRSSTTPAIIPPTTENKQAHEQRREGSQGRSQKGSQGRSQNDSCDKYGKLKTRMKFGMGMRVRVSS